MGIHYGFAFHDEVTWLTPPARAREDVSLSDVARAILAHASTTPISLRVLGDRAGYSAEHIRRGWQELCAARLARTIPYGRRRQYALRRVREAA